MSRVYRRNNAVYVMFKVVLFASAISCSEEVSERLKSEKSENHTTPKLQVVDSDEMPAFCSMNDELCCEETYNHFKQNWEYSKLFLTSLLENFCQANCSLFADQCKQRTFAYTEFTSLVYDRFCDEDTFRSNCHKGAFAILK